MSIDFILNFKALNLKDSQSPSISRTLLFKECHSLSMSILTNSFLKDSSSQFYNLKNLLSPRFTTSLPLNHTDSLFKGCQSQGLSVSITLNLTWILFLKGCQSQWFSVSRTLNLNLSRSQGHYLRTLYINLSQYQGLSFSSTLHLNLSQPQGLSFSKVVNIKGSQSQYISIWKTNIKSIYLTLSQTQGLSFSKTNVLSIFLNF